MRSMLTQYRPNNWCNNNSRNRLSCLCSFWGKWISNCYFERCQKSIRW